MNWKYRPVSSAQQRQPDITINGARQTLNADFAGLETKLKVRVNIASR
jgi:hypothetical protein